MQHVSHNYPSLSFDLWPIYGQQTSPMEFLYPEQLPLRKKVREYKEAQNAFIQYLLKIISGSVVGASGIIILNHSLGSISPNKPHQWAVTGIGAGLVGAGLLITKGAKKKRQKAIDIVEEKKQVAIEYFPGGLRLSF